MDRVAGEVGLAGVEIVRNEAKTEELDRVTPDTVGTEITSIPVELSTRFLEHFSEQLYSSPQKAFEELISNSWDARWTWLVFASFGT